MYRKRRRKQSRKASPKLKIMNNTSGKVHRGKKKRRKRKSMKGAGLKKLLGGIGGTFKNIKSSLLDKDSDLRSNIKENIISSIY